MEAQQLCQLSFLLVWIFVSFCPSVYSELGAVEMELENTVFVAFTGENLLIQCNLNITANQTGDTLTCSDPSHKQIYSRDVAETKEMFENRVIKLELKRLKSSGEYMCRYKTAEVYWFLHVRDSGYQDRVVFDYSQLITVAVLSGLLLLFSTVGSAFLLRGYWKERSQKAKVSEKEGKDVQTAQGSVDVSPPSPSFYASLETRPRSIYDVLDRSVTNEVPDQSGAKPKHNVPKNKVAESVHTQQDESVYENF
ncbi:uncharacterized protein si:ch211-243a20.4 isoform X1 [Takifugu flavidus]|uniref:uncharacterized protein si:ch211-243a20.4 isoform X1 n=2 Tax=Takifugu flavidus TaxID=433684 RepID=UPI0025442BCE|nr:uncharacterized protein si:ch211-243a20.4 isoform X1 [Takifugu flavidus]